MVRTLVSSRAQRLAEILTMGKREDERRQADRDFEEIRRAVAAQSDAWLCGSLREVPHRKWIEIEKDSRMAIGVTAHRAATRIEELKKELRIAKAYVQQNGGGWCVVDGEKHIAQSIIDNS